jgi:hypothetical protein
MACCLVEILKGDWAGKAFALYEGGTDMKLNLLATTAAAALLASSGMWAQAQAPSEHKAQAQEQKAQVHEQKGAAGHQSRAAAQDRGENKQLQTKDTAAETGKPAQNAQEKDKSARDQMNSKKDDAKNRGASKAAARQDQKKPESAAQNQNRDRKPGTDQKSASESPKGNAAKDQMNKAEATKAGKKNEQSKAAEQKNGDQKASESKQQAEKKDNSKASTNTAESKTGHAKKNESAQAHDKQNKDAAQKNGPTSQSASQQAKRPDEQATRSRERASSKLSETDKTKVFSTLKSKKQASNQRIDIRVNIGQRLPARVHPRPLPRTVVEVMPHYRGYDYVMVRDEIAIVRPGTREVVDVIHEPGSSSSFASMTRHEGSTTIHLTDQQRTRLRTEAKRFTSSQVSGAGSQCLTLQPVPSSIVNGNPDLKQYKMLSIGDDVVLVDPSQKKIVDVIQ